MFSPPFWGGNLASTKEGKEGLSLRLRQKRGMSRRRLPSFPFEDIASSASASLSLSSPKEEEETERKKENLMSVCAPTIMPHTSVPLISAPSYDTSANLVFFRPSIEGPRLLSQSQFYYCQEHHLWGEKKGEREQNTRVIWANITVAADDTFGPSLMLLLSFRLLYVQCRTYPILLLDPQGELTTF